MYMLISSIKKITSATCFHTMVTQIIKREATGVSYFLTNLIDLLWKNIFVPRSLRVEYITQRNFRYSWSNCRHILLALRRKRLMACLMAATALQSLNSTFRYRRCRRLQRNTGWWLLVWNSYSDERVKKPFLRKTFDYILSRIRDTN